MDLIRVYTDEDGVSRFEAIDPLRSDEWSKGLATSRCSIREMSAGTVMDWHPAPRRQLVIHLSGRLEIVLRDGTSHVFGPSSARLMDDVTGSGHLTRVVGEEPVLQAVILLAD
jgi:hypothetical protein